MQKSYQKIFLTLILTAVFGGGVFSGAGQASAATYYIGPDEPNEGSDDNAGTDIDRPWKTFAYALSQLEQGDTLIAKPGIFRQRIEVVKSGTAESPIVIQGTLDRQGNWLSVLDISAEVAGTWSDASRDAGMKDQPVWKLQLPQEPYTLSFIDTVNGNKPYSIYQFCQPHEGNYYRQWCNQWQNEITRAANERYRSDDNFCPKSAWGADGRCDGDEYNPLYWDGLDAIFSPGGSGLTHIRFRNGDNPNEYTFRWTPGVSVVNFSLSSHVTLANFEIRAAEYGIYVARGNSYLTLNNNRIYNGKKKIEIIDSIDSENHHITISNNVLFQQPYSAYISDHSYGPHSCVWLDSNHCSRSAQINSHLYFATKYHSGTTDSTNESNGINVHGENHEIFGNTIHDMVGGISMYANNTDIYNNTIYNIVSVGTYYKGGYFQNSSVHDNLMYNNGINFRFGNAELGGGPLYIYNNRVWLPEYEGQYAYFHMYTPAMYKWPIELRYPEVWWYHNTQSGGRTGMDFSDACNKWGVDGVGVICARNVHSVNNVISTHKIAGSYDTIPFGQCKNNWFGGNLLWNNCKDPALNNFYNGTELMWPPAPPEFSLPDNASGNAAKGSGVNIRKTPAYSFLPWKSDISYPDSSPDMGALQTGNPADVNADGKVNIKDIQACIKVITGSNMTYQNQCKVLAAPIYRTNIKDIQVIIRKIITP